MHCLALKQLLWVAVLMTWIPDSVIRHLRGGIGVSLDSATGRAQWVVAATGGDRKQWNITNHLYPGYIHLSSIYQPFINH